MLALLHDETVRDESESLRAQEHDRGWILRSSFDAVTGSETLIAALGALTAGIGSERSRRRWRAELPPEHDGPRFPISRSWLRAQPTRRSRALYVVLASHANADGTCWPGKARLRSILGVSRRTLDRALAEVQGVVRSGRFYRLLPGQNCPTQAHDPSAHGGQNCPIERPKLTRRAAKTDSEAARTVHLEREERERTRVNARALSSSPRCNNSRDEATIATRPSTRNYQRARDNARVRANTRARDNARARDGRSQHEDARARARGREDNRLRRDDSGAKVVGVATPARALGSAQKIAAEWWETHGRPQHPPLIAAVKIFDRFLAAGIPEHRLMDAAPLVEEMTLGGVLDTLARVPDRPRLVWPEPEYEW